MPEIDGDGIGREKELVLRIAAGDEQAFTALFRRYSFSMGILANKVLQDEAARQDVMQEVFIKLWLHREELPNIQYLPAWLKKVTLNESLMYLRKNAVYDKRLADLVLPHAEEENISQTIGFKELQQKIRDFISNMPEQRRVIYELNRVEGLSAKEIAEKLNLSHGHVRNTLSATLKSIRDHLGPLPYVLLSILLPTKF
ncbi:MAG: sigma-70 family RNA polymerase sigma factor [Niastella sp.]|nr:sigma-70 family RNA polymerase sigma factor [Niastella sp.]